MIAKLFTDFIRKIQRLLFEFHSLILKERENKLIYGLNVTQEAYKHYLNERRKAPTTFFIQMIVEGEVKESIVVYEINRGQKMFDKTSGKEIIAGQ